MFAEERSERIVVTRAGSLGPLVRVFIYLHDVRFASAPNNAEDEAPIVRAFNAVAIYRLLLATVNTFLLPLLHFFIRLNDTRSTPHPRRARNHPRLHRRAPHCKRAACCRYERNLLCLCQCYDLPRLVRHPRRQHPNLHHVTSPTHFYPWGFLDPSYRDSCRPLYYSLYTESVLAWRSLLRPTQEHLLDGSQSARFSSAPLLISSYAT